MKARKIVAALCLLALAGLPAVAQQDKPQGGMSKAEMDAMMQAMVKAGTPGENHKALDRYAGDWTTSMKMWMDPTQPPMETTGTMHAEWVLGGRYMASTYKGDFMGQPFEGHAMDGYDNVAGKYVSSWVDNMSTGIMNATGTCDAGCKTTTMMSEGLDPMGKPMTTRMVTTWPDDKTFHMEMFMKDASGQEMKGMELTAKRK